MLDRLKSIPLFEELPDDDLARIVEAAEVVSLGPGEQLFAEGDKGDSAYLIIEGEIEIILDVDEREELLAVRTVDEVIGEMALLEEAPRMATARAATPAKLWTIKKAVLDELLATSASAVRAMFRSLLTRWRETQAQLRQSERMAFLGTMSAGVAHELNNPAAAAKRAADQLLEARAAARAARSAVERTDVTSEQRAAIDVLMGAADEVATHTQMSTLERADREEAVEDWLDDLGVDEPWNLSSHLVSMGFDVTRLEEAVAALDPDVAGKVLTLLVADHTVRGLVGEIESSVGRISDIVRALKSYSYLDQAPVQEIDITEGIEDTLLIMKGKLDGITVERDYDGDLPRIEAYGSELNQVWTNLVDNAVYAINATGREDGVIGIRVHHDDGFIEVDVEDNGSGISEKDQARIFDSFFTTKPPGSGTGLGLDITYRIVVHRHRGSIEVNSEPGRTVFKVRLPMER